MLVAVARDGLAYSPSQNRGTVHGKFLIIPPLYGGDANNLQVGEKRVRAPGRLPGFCIPSYDRVPTCTSRVAPPAMILIKYLGWGLRASPSNGGSSPGSWLILYVLVVPRFLSRAVCNLKLLQEMCTAVHANLLRVLLLCVVNWSSFRIPYKLPSRPRG